MIQLAQVLFTQFGGTMRTRTLTAALALAAILTAATACSKSNAGSQDQAITQAVQNKLNADAALQGAGVTAAAQNGVVTLTGTVSSDAARSAAAADAQVPGVTQVNNQIGTNTPANPAAAAPEANTAMTAMKAQPRHASAAGNAGASSAAAPAPAMRATPPVEIEDGTVLHVRLSQALNSANASAGQTWEGTVSAPVRVNGEVAIPEGASITGNVVAADSAGHFKGQSRLVLSLAQLQYNGASYDLTTHSVTKVASSRGTRSTEAIGGGAAVGALIGALAGHGKGAAIGAASGAGAGTAVQALTKPAEVSLPAETVLSFTLSAPLQVVPAGSAH
ncbi:MAG: BON domain-containing protein [Terriglobales bacterium]